MADATPRLRCAVLPSTQEQILPNDFYQDASPLAGRPGIEGRLSYQINRSARGGKMEKGRREEGVPIFQKCHRRHHPSLPLPPFLACLTTFGRDIISPQRLYSSLSNNDNLQLQNQRQATGGGRPATKIFLLLLLESLPPLFPPNYT